MKYRSTCAHMGWVLRPFVMDVYGGFGKTARGVIQALLEVRGGQVEGWQRRHLELAGWAQISIGLMQEIGRQLAWGAWATHEEAAVVS